MGTPPGVNHGNRILRIANRILMVMGVISASWAWPMHKMLFLAFLAFSTERMNEWCFYIVLYCLLLYTQSALQSCGGGVSPQPPPVCSILHLDAVTAATGQLRQCAHHTPAIGGEKRESTSQSSVQSTEKLSLDWSDEPHKSQLSMLDECFLRGSGSWNTNTCSYTLENRWKV